MREAGSFVGCRKGLVLVRVERFVGLSVSGRILRLEVQDL